MSGFINLLPGHTHRNILTWIGENRIPGLIICPGFQSAA